MPTATLEQTEFATLADTLAEINAALTEKLDELASNAEKRNQDTRRQNIRELVRHADSSHTATLAAIGNEAGDYVYAAVSGLEGETRKGARKDSVKVLASDTGRTENEVNQWIRLANFIGVFPTAGQLSYRYVQTMLPVVVRDELLETYSVKKEYLDSVNTLIERITTEKLQQKDISAAVRDIMGKPQPVKADKSAAEATETVKNEQIVETTTTPEDCVTLGAKLTGAQLGALIEGFFAVADSDSAKYVANKVVTLARERAAAKAAQSAAVAA